MLGRACGQTHKHPFISPKEILLLKKAWCQHCHSTSPISTARPPAGEKMVPSNPPSGRAGTEWTSPMLVRHASNACLPVCLSIYPSTHPLYLLAFSNNAAMICIRTHIPSICSKALWAVRVRVCFHPAANVPLGNCTEKVGKHYSKATPNRSLVTVKVYQTTV